MTKVGRATSSGSASDAELMSQMEAANGDALSALMERYRWLIHQVALGILRDTGEAEDATQEVFFEVYRRAAAYDPTKGTVKGWLLQYAYRRSLRRRDTLRRRAAYRGELLEQAENLSCDYRCGLTSQERVWFIRAGLAHLPALQRTTLELACFGELSLSEIADRLGTSYGCAWHYYYYRGIAHLRKWAAGQERDATDGPRVHSPRAPLADQENVTSC